MDYGQPIQQPTQPTGPEFFTSGVGTNDEGINNVQSENNLDLSNTQANWGAIPERDRQSIGHQTINSVMPEQLNPYTSNHSESINQTSVPSEIVMPSEKMLPPTPIGYASLEPPIIEEAKGEAKDEVQQEPSIKDIKTTERLSDDGVKVVDHAVSEFNQNGNAADFYDKVREMMETNLENSYNRKLGAK